MITDLWYKNAVIYCLDVERYRDANGDGIGDFRGLAGQLDYLAGLGVTCLWLQPFYPSPNRDNGYDVTDYYGIDPKYGSLGDFVEFMHHARQLGLRVIVDLVVNHTSIRHPWFRQARRDPRSEYRDWYIWSKKRPADHASGMVFPGVQKTTWTWDEAAGEYYFHRFYDFQPDLNTANPAVQAEILRIMGFWIDLGVSGFRMDAVPFVIERKSGASKLRLDFDLLTEMRALLQWRQGDAVLLAEANVPPGESLAYFGPRGDRLQMMLNFPVNQRLFYALATEDVRPLAHALEATRERPFSAQWVHFLRSHDELDLGRLTGKQRERVFAAFGPEKHMQIYGRGIRRRLTPMLDNDRRRLELAFSLLLTLPGTPMLQYGDEIGMGDNLSLPERECARTPMQWSDDRNAGFSSAARTVRPVVDDPIYGYRHVNVASQRRSSPSLLNWLERGLRMRRECPAICWGDWTLIGTAVPAVLVMRYQWQGESLLFAHNFGRRPRAVRLDGRAVGPERLVDLLGDAHSVPDESGRHTLELDPYGYRWYRLGGFGRLPHDVVTR